jgi:hypothetical protein
MRSRATRKTLQLSLPFTPERLTNLDDAKREELVAVIADLLVGATGGKVEAKEHADESR